MFYYYYCHYTLQTFLVCASRRQNVRLLNRRNRGNYHLSAVGPLAYPLMTILAVCSSWQKIVGLFPKPIPNASFPIKPTSLQTSPIVARFSNVRMVLNSNIQIFQLYRRRLTQEQRKQRENQHQTLRMPKSLQKILERTSRCSLDYILI